MRNALVLLLVAAPPVQAQGPGIEVGRYFADTARTAYRLGASSRLLGPLGTGIYATLLRAPSPIGNYWGLGADLSLFRGGRSGLYLAGGVSGGVSPGSQRTFWGSWSAGLGYEVIPFSGLSLSAEGRWRHLDPGRVGGLEVSFRLGLDRGSRRAPERSAAEGTGVEEAPSSETVRRTLEGAGVATERASMLSAVVATATEAMGTPYRWGGEGESGFDCSGLIQYAFGQHGIQLPRRSADQARQGRAVERSVDAVLPGDILTFSSRGGPVTHVGLYVGDGRFIHSASRGVQLSVLSPDDVYGKWWWKRWVGVRRVIE